MDHPEPSNTPAAIARIGSDYRVEIDVGADGEHHIVADEPGSLGGENDGPDPFGLLYAALASCVLITIRMYATRKEWPLESAELRIFPKRVPPGPLESARLELVLHGAGLTPEHRERIVQVAGKCPVHRTLESPVHIETVEGIAR